MSDVIDQLRDLIANSEQEARSKAEEERWQRLEQKLDAALAAAPRKTERELLLELAANEQLMRDLEQELADEADQLDADDAGDEEDTGEVDDDADGDEDATGDDEDEVHDGPRYRAVRLAVPRIYGGEDEPDHVEYLDEQGKVRVRAGRKRGRPVAEEWEEIEPEHDDDESEDEDDE